MEYAAVWFIYLFACFRFDSPWSPFTFIAFGIESRNFETALGWVNDHNFHFWVRFLLPRISCTGCWIEHLFWQISFALWGPDRGYVSDWLGFRLFCCSDEVYVWNIFFHVPQKWRKPVCKHSWLCMFIYPWQVDLTCLMQQCLPKVFVKMSPDPL